MCSFVFRNRLAYFHFGKYFLSDFEDAAEWHLAVCTLLGYSFLSPVQHMVDESSKHLISSPISVRFRTWEANIPLVSSGLLAILTALGSRILRSTHGSVRQS